MIFGKFQNKRTLKFYLELNFNNFQKEKKRKTIVDCYNNLIVEIAIIKFLINIIKDLGSTIVLFFFLLYIIWKGKYYGIFFPNSFILQYEEGQIRL